MVLAMILSVTVQREYGGVEMMWAVVVGLVYIAKLEGKEGKE